MGFSVQDSRVMCSPGGIAHDLGFVRPRANNMRSVRRIRWIRVAFSRLNRSKPCLRLQGLALKSNEVELRLGNADHRGASSTACPGVSVTAAFNGLPEGSRRLWAQFGRLA